MSSLNIDIGKRIAQLRKINHMTQAQLAEALDISIKHCSSVERGMSRLSIEKLLEITELFHTSLDYLIRGQFSSNHFSELLPDSVQKALNSGDEEQLLLLRQYLQIYGDLLESNHMKDTD